jgi:hypothetical protein
MKVLSLLFVLTVSGAAAENIPSPDGEYVLEIGKSARIVDHSHATVLTVVPSVQGLREVAAQWSADSHRVVLVLNYDRARSSRIVISRLLILRGKPACQVGSPAING